MKYVFLQEAFEEYREAIIHIAKTSEQNSHLFIHRVEATLAYILKHPDANIRGRHGTLRRKIHRQSHWIVYRRLPSDNETLEIIAIAHERRGDAYYWSERFDQFQAPQSDSPQ